MFLEYFGFEKQPFGVTPEPRCLYQSKTHREALASLKYGYLCNRAFTALIAAPGMGKTTLLYRFLNDIRESARSVFLFDLDIRCEPGELIGYILRDLGINPAQSSAEKHEQLNRVLVSEARAGRTVVIVLDEAQNLSEAALETVRLLTNFETPTAKLLQIVLAGQPQLAEKLMQPSLAQLRQRISTVCRLEPFSPEETRAYIAHRLLIAGYQGEQIFSESALDQIAEASGGVPRMINNLCFNALSICRAMKAKQVTSRFVTEAIGDQQLTPIVKEPAGIPQSSDIEELNLGRERRTRGQSSRWIAAAAILVAAAILSVLGFFELREAQLSGWGRVRAVDSVVTPVSAAALPASKHMAAASELSQKPFEITIIPKQTLRDVCLQYLGEFSPACLQRIQALNPAITNPNYIEAGQTIWLPAPPAKTLADDMTPTGNVRDLQ